MANYFVGDIQGCYQELQALLAKVDFSPSTDTLWSVGDLVARGKGSLETLRFFKGLEGSGKAVLGNHDLHLMAVKAKIKRVNPKDHLSDLLNADDCQLLIDWLREQPLLRYLPEQQIVMSHAGIIPCWNIDTAQSQANKVSEALQKPDFISSVLTHMYDNQPDIWQDDLNDIEQIRFTINALTRMRFLHLDGRLNFDCKLPPKQVDGSTLKPWFDFDLQLPTSCQVIFGHWAALMGETHKPNIHALDTGCVWGEYLTLYHLETQDRITQKKI